MFHLTCFAVTESNSLSHASHVCFRLKGQVVRLCSLFFECFAVAASLPHMEGPHEYLEDTMDCEDADSSYKEPVEKKPRINEDAALTNDHDDGSDELVNQGNALTNDHDDGSAQLPVVMKGRKKPTPREDRSRSPYPRQCAEPPHEARAILKQTTKDIRCAVCLQQVYLEEKQTGWENWVYMVPGSWEQEIGMNLLRTVVSMVHFPKWINVQEAYVGIHGTFLPLCKWCMFDIAEKLPEMNRYDDAANIAENRTVTKEQAIIAGLICQQVRAKVKDAQRNITDKKAHEDGEAASQVASQLADKCKV